MKTITCHKKTDWFRVLADLNQRGVCNAKVSDLIDVPRGTIAGWKSGMTTPTFEAGHRLIRVWSDILGLDADDRPFISFNIPNVPRNYENRDVDLTASNASQHHSGLTFFMRKKTVIVSRD